MPDREIAWTVAGRIRAPIGNVYGYLLEPAADGTLATSYYDWSSISAGRREAGIFPAISEAALRATLGILAGRWRAATSAQPEAEVEHVLVTP